MGWTGTNPLQMAERSSDPAAIANNGQLYTKESSSRTELFFEDDAGNITQITKAGQLNSAEFSFPLLAPNGTAAAPSYSASASPTDGMYFAQAGSVDFAIAGTRTAYIQANSVGILSDTGTFILGLAADVKLTRDAAAVLALKNGTTAQEFRVYGTTTGSKYVRLSHNGTDAIFQSSSATERILIGTNLNTSWIFETGGGFTSNGNLRFSHGTSALATTATEGYAHWQSCAGAPTGVPASIPSGQVPHVFDTTNDRLYFYYDDGGGAAWHYIARTA